MRQSAAERISLVVMSRSLKREGKRSCRRSATPWQSRRSRQDQNKESPPSISLAQGRDLAGHVGVVVVADFGIVADEQVVQRAAQIIERDLCGVVHADHARAVVRLPHGDVPRVIIDRCDVADDADRQSRGAAPASCAAPTSTPAAAPPPLLLPPEASSAPELSKRPACTCQREPATLLQHRSTPLHVGDRPGNHSSGGVRPGVLGSRRSAAACSIRTAGRMGQIIQKKIQIAGCHQLWRFLILRTGMRPFGCRSQAASTKEDAMQFRTLPGTLVTGRMSLCRSHVVADENRFQELIRRVRAAMRTPPASWR